MPSFTSPRLQVVLLLAFSHLVRVTEYDFVIVGHILAAVVNHQVLLVAGNGSRFVCQNLMVWGLINYIFFLIVSVLALETMWRLQQFLISPSKFSLGLSFKEMCPCIDTIKVMCSPYCR